MLREEKETIINFNEAEGYAEVYTYNKKLQNKLDSLCEEFDDFSLQNQCQTGAKTYHIPKTRVSISRPRKPKVMTEQEKKELVERLNKHK